MGLLMAANPWWHTAQREGVCISTIQVNDFKTCSFLGRLGGSVG